MPDEYDPLDPAELDILRAKLEAVAEAIAKNADIAVLLELIHRGVVKSLRETQLALERETGMPDPAED